MSTPLQTEQSIWMCALYLLQREQNKCTSEAVNAVLKLAATFSSPRSLVGLRVVGYISIWQNPSQSACGPFEGASWNSLIATYKVHHFHQAILCYFSVIDTNLNISLRRHSIPKPFVHIHLTLYYRASDKKCVKNLDTSPQLANKVRHMFALRNILDGPRRVQSSTEV